MGPLHEPALPFASSLCGACAEVCPVKIEIPKLLLELRTEVRKSRLERLAFRAFAWLMRHPGAYEMAGLDLGDQRRNQRAVKILQARWQQPQASFYGTFDARHHRGAGLAESAMVWPPLGH